ncbi:MAG TPA: radical SAM protein [Saprospiraceae bacterium]|nr:radical SAM protein [Saprospiraceae bacterium]HMQ82297.1 radical SAM protein [Saprospiraceae bacterium]
MLPNLKLSYYNFYIPHPQRGIYLVYNSISNSMIQLDWATGFMLSKLNSMEIHYLDIEVIEVLRKNGMVISKHVDEFDVIAQRAASSRDEMDNMETLFMVIAPTNTCNMNCPYCYQGDKNPAHSDTKYLTPDNMEALKKTVRNIVEQPHAKPIKKISVEWFGGEPLVRKKVVEAFSDFLIDISEKHNLEFVASIITNGTLLDKETWEMLDRCKIHDVQITIDGNEEMHNKMRFYINGKGTYEKIMQNLMFMPPDKFKVVIRINGDRAVFDNLPEMFEDLEARGLWPQRNREISFHWAPKFYNYLGFNQDKDIYYTSYEYQKSREDFALLRLKKYNEWALKNNLRPKRLKVGYPDFAEFYCNTVESPNSISIDDGGYIHKCYNTINNKEKRIQHVGEFDPSAEGMGYYKSFDKTKAADCRTCKVLPICEENCNMRFLDNAESKICSAWKYFMDERMIALFEQNFSDQDEQTVTEIQTRNRLISVND